MEVVVDVPWRFLLIFFYQVRTRRLIMENLDQHNFVQDKDM